MDFARRFVNSENEWNNRSLAQLSLQYSYSDLFAATDGFHEKNKCGTGSYGAVYKGMMGDGTEVAIKVMDLPSEAGFEDEVRLMFVSLSQKVFSRRCEYCRNSVIRISSF